MRVFVESVMDLRVEPIRSSQRCSETPKFQLTLWTNEQRSTRVRDFYGNGDSGGERACEVGDCLIDGLVRLSLDVESCLLGLRRR